MMESRDTHSHATQYESHTSQLSYIFRYPYGVADYIVNTSLERNLTLEAITYSLATIASGMGLCVFIPIATFVTIPMDVAQYAKQKSNERRENNSTFFAKKIETSENTPQIQHYLKP